MYVESRISNEPGLETTYANFTPPKIKERFIGYMACYSQIWQR